jgi:hypothetical protein
MFDGSASFDEDTARAWLKNRVYSGDEKNMSLRQVRCALKRLDDLGLVLHDSEQVEASGRAHRHPLGSCDPSPSL